MPEDAMENPIPISDEQLLALKRATRNSEYHLLLGAGASLDSTSRNGQPLPGSATLIDQLCREFEVPAEENDLLWRIYDRAVEAAGEERVYTWLREKFWGTKHPYWMEYYARSPWSTVWTLNVDDSFESAYRSILTESSRQLETLNWDDSYRHNRKLNVVHLHGVVDSPKPRRLVFSLSEYAGTAESKAAWPANFHDSYGNSPFVILGARLRDEPDIEAVVSRRRPAHPAPSFYVARTITPAMRTDLKRWGLVPVEMTAEEFVLEWSEMTGLDLEEDLGTETELGIRVGQQFTELKPASRPAATASSHDFLGGDEPEWGDIERGLAAELEWVTKAKFDCNQIGKTLPKSALLAYTGHRLTGRSTGLLQLGHHLRQSAWRVFSFRNDGRFDTDALLSYAADGKSIALLFDGISDLADDLNRLISLAKASGARIACIGVEDSNREANIISRVSEANLAFSRIGKINDRLSGVDAARLVDTLESAGRLGVLENKPDGRRLEHFKRNDLFSSMAQLENAPGFGRRVEDLIKGLSGETDTAVALFASYASFVNRRLMVIDASRMVGINSDELIRHIQKEQKLSALVSTDGLSIRPKQRWMALSPIVTRLGSETAAATLRDAVRELAPRLSKGSVRDRTPTAMLVGSFMSHRNLESAFPGADLDNWYSSLIDVFGPWSARYWEQRAILARRESVSDASLLAKAESFAMRAIGLVADTYSFTTLGTVLLEKAARTPFDISAYYERGYSAFESAAALDTRSKNAVTWTAYLRYSLPVLQRISTEGVETARAQELHDLWNIVNSDWMRVYSQLALIAGSSDSVRRDLQRLRTNHESIGNPFAPPEAPTP